MKKMNKAIIMTTLFLSLSTQAKVTMEDVNRDSAAIAASVPDQQALQAELETNWNLYNQPPETSGGSDVAWSDMPSGAQCGYGQTVNYKIDNSKTIKCDGYNPASSCSSSFVRAETGKSSFTRSGGSKGEETTTTIAHYACIKK